MGSTDHSVKTDIFYYFSLVIFTAFVTPYRLAFYDTDSLWWQSIDYVIDFLFTVDIVLNFFVAFYRDNDDITLVDNLKVTESASITALGNSNDLHQVLVPG